MRNKAIKTIEYKDHTIKIYPDTDAESPRDWDNVGTMVCWHGRYNLGDDHKFASPDDFQEWLKENDCIVLPLYLYDHSGITISTGKFSCPWDSGQIGYIYVTKEKALKEFDTLEKASKCLEQEVETYDSFLTGEVYGYSNYGPLSEDSCWGYLGDMDYCISEAKSAIDWAIENEAKQSALTASVTAL